MFIRTVRMTSQHSQSSDVRLFHHLLGFASDVSGLRKVRRRALVPLLAPLWFFLSIYCRLISHSLLYLEKLLNF